MPIVVEVKTQADYDKWLATQKDKYGVGKAAAAAVVVDTKTYTRDELVAHGKTVYEGWVAVRAVINRLARASPAPSRRWMAPRL